MRCQLKGSICAGQAFPADARLPQFGRGKENASEGEAGPAVLELGAVNICWDGSKVPCRDACAASPDLDNRGSSSKFMIVPIIRVSCSGSFSYINRKRGHILLSGPASGLAILSKREVLLDNPKPCSGQLLPVVAVKP